MKRGLSPGACPERMNLDAINVLEDIAGEYFEAGAELIQTNTFGASPLKLDAYGLRERAEEINQRAVDAVRRAVGDRAYVSASCGPSGRILEPYGDTQEEVVYESFRRQIGALVAAGVDLICIETMTDLREAVLAVRAAKSVVGTIPVAVSMTFDPTPGGFRTVMGNRIEDAVRELTEAGADIIGSNCGHGIQQMAKIAGEFLARSTLPVIIQSNAGLPIVRGGEVIYPEDPFFMAGECSKLASAGVRIIGGCCGTTPAHIAAIASALRAARS